MGFVLLWNCYAGLGNRPSCSTISGTFFSQPIAIMWIPWQMSLSSLIKLMAISIPVLALSSASAIWLISSSGTKTPATFLFMNRAIPADFRGIIPARTGTLNPFAMSDPGRGVHPCSATTPLDVPPLLARKDARRNAASKSHTCINVRARAQNTSSPRSSPPLKTGQTLTIDSRLTALFTRDRRPQLSYNANANKKRVAAV